jgi:serine/threonine-protein kinase
VSSADVQFRRLGPYLLLQLSGAGGMGRVDVALSIKPDGFTKLCVLKRMLPDLRTPEQEARFRREATIALRLSHGGIAQTLDVVEIEGELCLLQEFIHGTTLAHLENRAAGANERIPVEIALYVGVEIARALAYAHSFDGRGVVHRDVTPDNIMLSFSGEAKLVDFGIARAPAEQPLTEVGLVVGRPLYTAPEVLAGGAPSPRADIYSLGVVLWQALTGRPFNGAPPGSIEPPSASNGAVPQALDAIVLRALALRPDDRYASAAELQAALAALMSTVPPPDQALAAFLARHFNVERERRQLADDIDRARAMVGAESSDEPASDRERNASPVASRRRGQVGLAALALVLGAGLAGWSIGRRAGGERAYEPVRVAAAPVVAHEPSPEPSQPQPPAPVPAVAEAPTVNHNFNTRRPGRSTEGSGPPRNNAALLRDANRSFTSGDLARAMELARRAVREGAGSEGHVIMGKIFYARNQLAEAEAEFQRALGASPQDAEASRYLGLVREDLGRSGR